MSMPYGPVPVSRLKAEATPVFEALRDGRRVLISRHGKVVAAIDPADIDRYALELAEFALPQGSDNGHRLAELTASELGQGSPSEFIRDAEAGVRSYVTRNNKVYGVLMAIGAQTPRHEDLPEMVDARERALARFEQEHPDATPAEFAHAVAAWRPDPTDMAPASAARAPEPPPVDQSLLASALATLSAGIDQVSAALHLPEPASAPASRAAPGRAG